MLSLDHLRPDLCGVGSCVAAVVAPVVVNWRWLAPSEKEPKHVAENTHSSADYVHARQDIPRSG